MKYIKIIFLFLIPIFATAQEHKLYPYLGIMDDNEFIKFYDDFKIAVNKHDSIYIAGILHYPLKAMVNNKYIELKTKEDFFKNYRKIFTKKLIKIINEQDVNNFGGIGNEGVTCGIDAIWFNTIGNERNYKFYIVIFNGTETEEEKENWLKDHKKR